MNKMLLATVQELNFLQEKNLLNTLHYNNIYTGCIIVIIGKKLNWVHYTGPVLNQAFKKWVSFGNESEMNFKPGALFVLIIVVKSAYF